MRYLMAFICMYFIRSLILGLGILRLSSCVIECLCTTPCMFAKNIIMGLTFHRCCLSVSISGSYFLCLVLIAVSSNML